jgi:hypothetical protein
VLLSVPEGSVAEKYGGAASRLANAPPHAWSLARGLRLKSPSRPKWGSGAPGNAGLCESPWAAGDAALHAADSLRDCLQACSLLFAIEEARLTALHLRLFSVPGHAFVNEAKPLSQPLLAGGPE